MKHFLRRLGRTVLDMVTSKKAIATAVAVVATAAGAPEVGAVIAAYVLAQGAADVGKERAKEDGRAMAERLRDAPTRPAVPPPFPGRTE